MEIYELITKCGINTTSLFFQTRFYFDDIAEWNGTDHACIAMMLLFCYINLLTSVWEEASQTSIVEQSLLPPEAMPQLEYLCKLFQTEIAIIYSFGRSCCVRAFAAGVQTVSKYKVTCL